MAKIQDSGSGWWQWSDMLSVLGTVTLSSSIDRWVCDLNGEGVFRVKEIRSILDDLFLPSAVEATRSCRGGTLHWVDVSSFADWNAWFATIRLSSKLKLMLEGVFYVAWWHIWAFRNHSIFDEVPPRRSVIFDDIVSRSFTWCDSRCFSSFS
ncbi:hypothetical protein Tco_1352228 [Tanacetum coccineum]